jgi:hypothetical protein
MAVPTITHDELLARLARPWVEIVPGRSAIPRRDLPAHAHEPSPNVIASALSADRTSLDVCGQFRLKHRTPRFNAAHVPCDFAWQIVAPGGQRLLIFTWTNWLRNSRQLFEAFCRETGRETGTLTPDGVVVMESRSIPLRDCRLVHEDRFRPRPPVAIKKMPAKTVVAKAEELLKGRTSRFEDLDHREPYDEKEAHDDDLQRTLEASFLANMASYEKALVAKFGPPTEAGPGGHDAVPVNGLLRHAVWASARNGCTWPSPTRTPSCRGPSTSASRSDLPNSRPLETSETSDNSSK